MSTASRLALPPGVPACLRRRVCTATRTATAGVDHLVDELRTRFQRLRPGQRQLRPEQVAVGYGVHAGNTSVATAVQVASHAAASAGDVVWTAASAASVLVAGVSAPVETVKTGLEVCRLRSKARVAWERARQADALLEASRQAGDAVQEVRAWLDRRHGLEAWVSTRHCFQGTSLQLKRRRDRWQGELQMLQRQPHLSRSEKARRTRLERRLEAVRLLGPRRIAELRSGAVSVEKRFKEGISASRNLGGVMGMVSNLAAGGSPFLAFVATVCLPVLLPLLLLVDGVAGSVEATQLIRRARSGRQQLDASVARIDRAIASLPPASDGARALAVIRDARRDQARQWRRERWQGWIRRARSAAFLVLAPVALGLGVAALVGVGATPAGWVVAGLLGAVVVGYCIAQAVLNHRSARQARAVVARQQDHQALTRRQGQGWVQRTGKLADPVWAGNEYLAIELLVRALVDAANDARAWTVLDQVLDQNLACGRQWRGQIRQLARQIPQDAAPDHPDIWRLSEALMRRFGLPVPKPRHRPGAA